MGQYFIPTFLDRRGTIAAALHPRDFGSADKIYGHSRDDQSLMRAVEALLSLDGGLHLVWAGEYADDEPARDANLYQLCEPAHFVRFAELICDEPGLRPNATLTGPTRADAGYICNPTRGEYIDKAALPRDDKGCRRNPLPNLTHETRGSAGRWARDRLYYSLTRPAADWTRAPDLTLS